MKMMVADDFDKLKEIHNPAEKKKPSIKITVPFDFWKRIKAWKNRKKHSDKSKNDLP
jgi:hypothetical protein